jgi:arylsulfatase A-like enzyme
MYSANKRHECLPGSSRFVPELAVTRVWGSSFLLISLLFLLGGTVSKLPAQVTPPNIVIILADDLGYGDVAFDDCPDFDTPHIDSLVISGVRCSNGYSPHPFCAPSRAGLLTGRYQQRFGFENNSALDPDNDRLGLPLTETLLPALLKPAGYYCGAIGKWHLGSSNPFHPMARGFDTFYGFLDGASAYTNAVVLDDYTTVTEPEYLTDAFTREALSFIDAHAGTPFFLYLAYNAPHSPKYAPQEYLDRVPGIADPSRKTHAAMMIALDDGVGAVIQSLASHSILNNTLIIFLSDNGAPNVTYVRNIPFRGYKFDTLEGGIHVPFALRWDGHLPAGTVFEPPVTALDLVPTIAAAAGITLPTDRVYDGLDLTPYIHGTEVMPERTLFWRFFGLGPTGPPNSKNTLLAVRKGPLKLVVSAAASTLPPELYNLVNDVGETENLAAAQPSDVAVLSQAYADWNLEMIAPVFQFNSPFLSPLADVITLTGDWNNFGITDTDPPWGLSWITAPDTNQGPDGITWYRGIVHASSTGGDTNPGLHNFALVGGKSYANQWGGGTIAIDAVNSLSFFSGTELGPTSSITLTDGFYYSFRVLDPMQLLTGPLNLAVMKTSAPPVTLTRASQTPATPLSGDPIVVTISTSQTPSLEERIYVRWTNDSYISSQMAPATGSGTSYSATIPAQAANTSLQYTVVSSTVDLSTLTASGAIDPLILATTDSYHSVILAPPPTPTPTPTPTATPTPTPTPTPSGLPVITQQPADANVKLGRAARFQVVATGQTPLRYQWRKNGSNITGATKAGYKTPPVAQEDNGAAFDVVVSNRLGNVTSAPAILTLR